MVGRRYLLAKSSNMKSFYRTLCFDFGSSNTIVCDGNGQVVFDEPTMIASFYGPNEPILIGNKAMIAPQIGPCKCIKPIIKGYVGDYEAFESYVKGIIRKIVLFPRLCLKTIVIAMPDDLVGDEDAFACYRAFFEPFRKMGVKDIRTIHKSIAVFLGTKYIVNSKL